MNKNWLAVFLSLILIVSLAVPAVAATDDPISIILQPEDQVGYAGDTISFTVVAFGSNLTYAWYMYMPQNPDDVTFLTDDQSWAIPLSESYDGIGIYCILKDDLGNEVKSDTATITVLPGEDGILIVRQPKNQTGKAGEIVLFDIQARGEDLTYAWYMYHPQMPDLTEMISTEDHWAVEIDEEMDGFCFYCVVTNGEGKTRKSDTVTLTVIPEENPLKIREQPKSVQVYDGDTATFNLKASGNDLSYQWQVQTAGTTVWKNSGMSGNTTATLTVPAAVKRNGQKYRCVVTDGSGKSLTSSTATLTVKEVPLAITTQPSSIVVTEGQTAQFTVKASGKDLSYRWQVQTTGTTAWKNSSMTGHATETLAVPAAVKRNGQKYRCVVTDGSGKTLTSSAATLTVKQISLAIKTQPSSIVVTEGQTAKFAVKASGKNLSYQWQVQTTGTAAWKNSSMTGHATEMLTVPATMKRNGQKYRCIITDGYGKTATSNAATLTVKVTALTITTHPSSATVTEGQSVQFAVKATGNNLSYQWQYKKPDGSWKNCTDKTEGYNTSDLRVDATSLRNGYQYRCIIMDGIGKTATSNAATLTVRAVPLQITAQPSSISVIEGKTAQFSVVATGSNLKYQWQYQSSGTTAWKNSGMTGSTTATLKVPAIMNRNGQKYRCVVTDGGGNSVTSEAATLSVRASITITTQPSDIRSYEGRTARFSVKATGNNLKYQWQYRSPGGETWKNSGMTGNTTTILNVPVTKSRNGQLYRCIIEDGDGNKVTSDSARLIVGS